VNHCFFLIVFVYKAQNVADTQLTFVML